MMEKPRTVLTIKAQNKVEAKAALELVMDKLDSYLNNEEVEERVEVICEGVPK